VRMCPCYVIPRYIWRDNENGWGQVNREANKSFHLYLATPLETGHSLSDTHLAGRLICSSLSCWKECSFSTYRCLLMLIVFVWRKMYYHFCLNECTPHIHLRNVSLMFWVVQVWKSPFILDSISMDGMGTQGDPCTATISWSIVYPHLLYLAPSLKTLTKYIILLTESDHGHLVP
jgi:hypothetical protein